MTSLHIQFKLSDTQEPAAFIEYQRLLKEGYKSRDIFPPLLAERAGHDPTMLVADAPVTTAVLQAAFEQQRQEFEMLLEGIVGQIVNGVLADVKAGKLQPHADDPFEGVGGERSYSNSHAARYKERYKK